MRRAARVDGNQAEIVAALRKVGAGVLHLHQLGEGAPDLLVIYRDVLYLMEIKMPGEGLTEDEVAFHASWPGIIFIVRSAEQALAFIGAV